MRRNFLTAFAIAALLVLGVEAHAVQLVNRSFEQGNLNGWDYLGDVSAQTADLGVTPTHGQYAALLATSYGGPNNPENPLGRSFSPSFASGWYPEVAQWLGLPPFTLPPPPEWMAFGNWEQATGANLGGGVETVMRQQSIELNAGDLLSFDWNFVGDLADRAWALFYPTNNPFWDGGQYIGLRNLASTSNPTKMDLAAYDPLYCGRSSICSYETGWQRSYFVAPSDGEYSVAFGIWSDQDPVYYSALWLDNFHVGRASEPSTLALLGLGLGLAGLAATHRRRQ